jgi:hypothetical protein
MYEMDIPQRTLGIRTHPLPRRRVQPLAAIKAGLAGGAIALVLLQFIAVVIYDESPWRLFRAIAAMVRGPGVMEYDDEFDATLVALATVLYLALSVLYSLALACIVADAPRRYSAVIGIAFGIALYHANYYGFTAIFPWFTPYRTIDTLLVHAVLGLTLALGYWTFRRR